MSAPSSTGIGFLEHDLRQAFTNFNKDIVSGPWDDLVELLASVVYFGTINLEQAARLSLLLARTHGGATPDRCDTCECPMPGQFHGHGG